jgi:hypothetical protein
VGGITPRRPRFKADPPEQKADELIRAGMAGSQNHLEGNEAVELGLPGQVDHSHTAAAQFPDDVIAGHGRAYFLGTWRGSARRSRGPWGKGFGLAGVGWRGWQCWGVMRRR